MSRWSAFVGLALLLMPLLLWGGPGDRRPTTPVPSWLKAIATSGQLPAGLTIEFSDGDSLLGREHFRVEGRGRGKRWHGSPKASARWRRLHQTDILALLRVIVLEHRFITRQARGPKPEDHTSGRLRITLGQQQLHYRGPVKRDARKKAQGLSLVRFRLHVLLPRSSDPMRR